MGKIITPTFGGGAPQQQPQQVNMAKLLESAKTISCECGSETFMEGYKLRLISKIMTGQPADTIVPMQVMICTACGTVLPLSDPTE